MMFGAIFDFQPQQKTRRSPRGQAKHPCFLATERTLFGGRFDGCILQNGVLLKDGNSIFKCENFDVTARNARNLARYHFIF